MSVRTKTAGYPVHAVSRYCEWTNQHGVRFTTWISVCGARNTTSGHNALSEAGHARKGELCRLCFPTRHWDHVAPGADAVKMESLDSLSEE